MAAEDGEGDPAAAGRRSDKPLRDIAVDRYGRERVDAGWFADSAMRSPAVGEPPHAVAPGGSAEPELDLREGGVERLDGGRDDGLHPQRRLGDAEAAGAPGQCRHHHVLALLDLAQDAPRALDDQGAEPGRAHAGGDALEQAAAELPLQAGDDAAERGLGHGRERAAETGRRRGGRGGGRNARPGGGGRAGSPGPGPGAGGGDRETAGATRWSSNRRPRRRRSRSISGPATG